MQITIQELPGSLQEFEALAGGPRASEKICARSLFDGNQDAGTAAMNLLCGSRPMTPYDQQFLRDRLRG